MGHVFSEKLGIILLLIILVDQIELFQKIVLFSTRNSEWFRTVPILDQCTPYVSGVGTKVQKLRPVNAEITLVILLFLSA